jgi:diacylglycerol kinase family enzyme
MKVVVLLNEESGACVAGAAPLNVRTIEAALRGAGVEPEVRCVPGQDVELEAKAAAAAGTDAVIACGGDGTISAVAAALAGTETALGVLPAGTLNHFAKDLGIPLELEAAAQVIAAGRIALVDVGTINSRVFINNSSLGVYAWALVERDATRSRRGWSKWPAMTLAAVRVFWRSPLLRVRLDTADGSISRKTPLVFVGNNRYRLDLFKVGARDQLDGGELSLYVANVSTRWGMLKTIFRALFGQLEQARDFENRYTTSVWIEARRKRRHVAIDGEVVRMAPPYHYRIWPQALRVFVPLQETGRT